MITLNGGDVVMTGLEKQVVDSELKARAARILELGQQSMDDSVRAEVLEDTITHLKDRIQRLQTRVVVNTWREKDNFENFINFFIDPPMFEAIESYAGIQVTWRPEDQPEAKGYTEVDGKVTGMIVEPEPYRGDNVSGQSSR